jgi:hypothetical protein
MGDVKARPSLLWRVVEAVSALLSPAERLAVLGDLTEAQVRDGQALRHMAGLVLRRQVNQACSIAGLCATFLLALPIGFVLGARAQHWAAGAGVYLWTFLGVGSFEPLARTVWNTGVANATNVAVWVLLNAATLAVWSTGAGWALGAFARRGIWIPVLAFYVTVLLVSVIRNDIGILPRHPAFAALGVVATATAVHSALLVIAPALYGLWLGRARRPVSAAARVVFAMAIVLLTYRAVGV